MRKVLVVFHTSEGQTAKVAERIAAVLRDDAFDVELHDVADAPGPEAFDGVVLGDSIHTGRHSRALTRYLEAHRGALARRPTALFQVSLTSANPDAETQRPRRSSSTTSRSVRVATPTSSGCSLARSCTRATDG